MNDDLHDDVLVYVHPDGRDYVALIGERWLRWPAEKDGWQRRQGCSATTADVCEELEPALAALALRLSGVLVGER